MKVEIRNQLNIYLKTFFEMVKLTFVNGHHIVDSVKYGSPSTWGAIDGDINEQRDLSLLLDKVKQDNADTKEQLSTKADKEHTHLLKDITDYVAPNLSIYATKEEIPSLEGYATEQWVENKNYLTTHQSLKDYYTKIEVDTKLKAISGYTPTDLSKYYTKEESDGKYALKTSIPSLEGYATEQWVENKNYLTQHQSLTDYAKKTELANYYTKAESDGKYALSTDIPSLNGYATEKWVENQGYLTSHQSLADYATKEQLSTKADKEHTHLLKDITDYVAPNLSIYASFIDW